MTMNTPSSFSALLQAYFTERLMGQRNASPHTIASYRDTFRLLIAFAERCLKKPPTKLSLEDLDAPFILRFLNSLEKERGNTPQTRNCRLAVIHSFFTYASLQEPASGLVAQRVLAIQSKRCVKNPVGYLTRVEVDALLDAPDLTTWAGRRDRTLLLLAVETGLRVSELVSLRWQDVVFGTGAHVICTGKGRKTRCVPLRKETEAAMHSWKQEQDGQPAEPVFPNARGRAFSRDGVEYLLSIHANTASTKCPSLKNKRVSPHVLRHSLAMNLLEHGVDCSVIALWLGHESLETTQIYLHANLALTEQALAKTEAFKGQASRYHPPDQLRTFLESL
jgi:site-specific recombinase XerD